jgi:hypothetical protein
MTKELALVIDNSNSSHDVHRQQLKATTDFIAGKKHSAPFTLQTVEEMDLKFHPFMRLPYDVRYEVLKNMVPQQNIRAFLRRERVGIQLRRQHIVSDWLRRHHFPQIPLLLVLPVRAAGHHEKRHRAGVGVQE